MRFTDLRPMLWTEKLEETIDFYVNTLGFICGEKNTEWRWASLYKDDIAIMLAGPNAHSKFDGPKFTGSFYINTDNVDALWEQLKAKVKICYSIDTFEWQMREFAIYDNNGYIIQFGQDLTIK